VQVNVSTKEENLLTSLAKDILPLFFFLILLAVAFKFMMPK
jgi:hypothetical protein